jgi:hypothetical protein
LTLEQENINLKDHRTKKLQTLKCFSLCKPDFLHQKTTETIQHLEQGIYAEVAGCNLLKLFSNALGFLVIQ